jgi:hypothetical protein
MLKFQSGRVRPRVRGPRGAVLLEVTVAAVVKVLLFYTTVPITNTNCSSGTRTRRRARARNSVPETEVARGLSL